MKRGHAEILGTHKPEHQRITNLVQSTDQRCHLSLTCTDSGRAWRIASPVSASMVTVA